MRVCRFYECGDSFSASSRLKLNHYSIMLDLTIWQEMKVRTSFCPLLIHDTMPTLSTPNRLSGLDFVLGSTVYRF